MPPPASLRHRHRTRAVQALGEPDRLAQLSITLAQPGRRPRLPVPDVIGPWHVGREVGRGGSSVVCEAWRDDDPDALPCVLKLTARPDAPDLAHEARVLGMFAHRSVAALVDEGRLTDGRSYLVMERIDGQPVVAATRRWRPLERLAVFRDLGRAVAMLHRRRVVHADLKPGNLFVRDDGSVVLLDFGSACRLDVQAHAERRPLTPEFAAPEQIVGQALCPATDVYALGLLLHEMFCGRRMRVPWALGGGFSAEVLPRAGAAQARARNRRASLRRLARSPASLCSSLRPVLERALHPDPACRYPSAVELTETVDALLRTLAMPPETPISGPSGLRRSRFRRSAAV